MNKAVKLAALALLVILAIILSVQAGMRWERTRCDNAVIELRASLAQAQNIIRDWPQLRRYSEANAGISSPQPSERRVVFIGDSITDYWGREGSGGFFPGKPYINRGISGQVTGQMLARFRQDVIALNPSVVVILGGTNDLNAGEVETTFNNLASMAEIAGVHNIRVILASVLPINDYGRKSEGQPARQRKPAKIIELNNRIKEYADAHGLIYLDYYSAMIDDKGMLKAELANDGLHPNEQGYAVMAPLAEQAINNALNSKAK